MSVEAITWALNLRLDRSSTKFVLVAMANCANSDMTCYPSVAYLADATSQNQKTVGENIRRLKEMGLIQDTGKRKGSTKQVVVYHLKCHDEDPFQVVNKDTENGGLKDPRKRNTSKNGGVSRNSSNSPENGGVKDARKRNTSENGGVPQCHHNTTENGSVKDPQNRAASSLERPPKTARKTPDFGLKDPQKRGTEPSGTVINQKRSKGPPVDNFPPVADAADENPAALLSVATENLVSTLVELGVKVSGADPLPWNWAERGVTEQIARRAVAVARQRKPAGPIPPKYLAPIIEEFLAAPDPPDRQRRPAGWWNSESGTLAMGQTLGVIPLRGESMPEFRSRIQIEIEKQKNQAQRRA